MFYGYDAFLILALILVVRYFVWRKRYREINARLDSLAVRVGDATTSLDRLGDLVDRRAAEAAAAAGTPRAGAAWDTLVAAADEAAAPAAALEASEGELAEQPPVPLAEWPQVEALATPEAAGMSPLTPRPSVPAVAARPAPPRLGLFARIGGSIQAALARAGGGAELEALIGGNWLNKIGVFALVIGMALLSSYAWDWLGPWGKIALGVSVSAVLLGASVWLERLERYTLFARPLIGGGWALLYFTAYAAHNFEASRVIEDPVAGLFVMLAVAAGMVGHSLRYRSEMVTGVAYVLAFVAVDINPLDLYSLLAGAFLGASMVLLLWRFAWHRLTLGAVVATYLTHFLWLQSAQLGDVSVAVAFWTAEGMLILYWAIFAVSEFLREPEREIDRQVLFATTVLNALAFTGLSYRLVGAAFPDGYHLFADAIAVGAVAMSVLLASRARRSAHIFYGLYSGAASFVAIPLAIAHWSLASEWLAIGWAGLAAALLATGLWRREFAFRAGAYLVGAAATAAALAVNISGLSPSWLPPAAGGALGWSTVALIAAALFVGEWLVKRVRDRLGPRDLPYILYGLYGGAFAFVAIPLAFNHWSLAGEWLAIGWGGLAAALLAVGLWRREFAFRIEAYLVGTAATATALVVNVFGISLPDLPAAPDGDVLRWSTIATIAAALLVAEWVLARVRDRLDAMEQDVGVSAGYAATVLLACTVFQDAGAAYLGILWLAGGILAFEIGLAILYAHARYRGYALLVAGFIALIVNNANLLWAATDPLQPPYRWMALAAAAAAFFAVAWRIKTAGSRSAAKETALYPLAAHAGALFLALLVWNELPIAAIAVAWAFLALVLHQAGVRLREPALRAEAYVLAAFAWGRLFLVDFVAIGSVAGVSTRVLTVIPVAALLYFFRHAIAAEPDGGRFARLETRLPVLFSFAATIALFALARFEFGRPDAVAAWSVLAVVVLAVGVRYGNWDYRIQAYLIAVAAFARSWTTNFYLDGTLYGVPERVATTIPVIVALFAIGLLWRRRRMTLAAELAGGLPRPIGWLDAYSIQINSGLGVALTALLILYSADGNYLTIAWALEGLAATAAGFAIKERTLRLSGLGLLAICLVKGFVIDLAGVDPIFRILSFIVLGAILVGISFAYTRYRHILKTYI